MRGLCGHEKDALIVGRFQPFHNGHLEVIRKIASENEHIVIVVGSAQCSHTDDNPFTAGERYYMIAETLKDEGIDNFSIVPVEDINRYSVWVSHVETMCPPFTSVYSNNKTTRRLFYEAGYYVYESPIFNRKEYSGTEVRDRICRDGDWKSLVPKKTAEIIEQIDGVSRIKEIMGVSPDDLR